MVAADRIGNKTFLTACFINAIHLALLTTQQEVLGLDVAVHDAVLVEVADAGEGLVHDVGDLLLRELLISPGSLLHLVEQRPVGILKNYVHFVLFLVVDYLFELNNVGTLIKFLQRGHLRHL